MKFLFSSDWQFADYARLSRITSDGITSRLLEFCQAFRWSLEVAVEHGITEIVILGDFFDDRVSVPVTVLHKVAELMLEGVNNGLAFHLLVGNHDSALKNPSITSLLALEGFAQVYNRPKTVMSLGFVPWTADVDTLSKWCDHVADEGADYLLSHVMVAGAVPPAKAIPVEALRPERFKRVLLGDVHDPVTLAPNIQYIGAPLQINFGDAGQKRGVWILDMDKDSFEFIENTVSPRFWNIDKPEDRDLPIKQHDYVKIRLEDPEQAEEAYADLIGCQTNYVTNETVTIEDEEPRLNVRTKDRTEEVLRAYCEHQGIKPDQLEDLIEAGLDIIEEAKVS